MFIKYLNQYTIFFINLTMSLSRTLKSLKSLRSGLLKKIEVLNRIVVQ